MRRRWAGTGIVLVLLLAVAWLIGSSLGRGSRARFPSSFAAEPEGLLGFRLLLEQSGISTTVMGRPWDETLAGDVAGVLLVATPLRRPPDWQEAEALRFWVESGGALLVIDDATAIEAPEILDSVLAEMGLDAERPVPDWDEQTLGMARPRKIIARGTPAAPSDASWRKIGLNMDAQLDRDARAIPLAINHTGVVFAGEAAFGAGRVVRVMGPLMANDRILDGDNLEFALALVADLRDDGPVLFDEYHQGYGGLLNVRRLDRAVLLWALLQVLVVAVVFGLARGVRFGPVRHERPPQRRSSLEFVHSMASLYRRAGARRHVVEGAWQRFLREARARWGMTEAAPTRQMARTVARLGGAPVEDVARTLEATARALGDAGPRTEAEMVTRVRDLDRLEKESFG